MKPAQGTRSLIRDLYPGREALIDRGLDEDSAFLELCEDYRRCFIVLENLRQPATNRQSDRVREYEELLAELGRELDGWLDGLVQGQA